MKRVLKWLSVSLAAAMLAVGFSGCTQAGDTPSSTTGEGTKTEAGANYNLVSEGKLVMGTNAEFPPFEYREGGKAVGVDPAIMAKVAEKLGLELEINDMAFEALDGSLTSDKIDVIAAGYTITDKRLQSMDFCDTYYKAKQTVIVKSDSSYQKKDDLKDKKIGGQQATTGVLYSAPELTAKENIKEYANGATAVLDLLAGRIDAVIIDNYPAKAYKQENGDKIRLIENQFEDEDYAYAVKKGNTALRDAINQALAEMKSDGTFDQIISEYIK